MCKIMFNAVTGNIANDHVLSFCDLPYCFLVVFMCTFVTVNFQTPVVLVFISCCSLKL